MVQLAAIWERQFFTFLEWPKKQSLASLLQLENLVGANSDFASVNTAFEMARNMFDDFRQTLANVDEEDTKNTNKLSEFHLNVEGCYFKIKVLHGKVKQTALPASSLVNQLSSPPPLYIKLAPINLIKFDAN